jgi:hypothetical protein
MDDTAGKRARVMRRGVSVVIDEVQVIEERKGKEEEVMRWIKQANNAIRRIIQSVLCPAECDGAERD